MKKIKLSEKKLELNKQVIAKLTPTELRKIKGGGYMEDMAADCPPSDRLCSGGKTSAVCGG